VSESLTYAGLPLSVSSSIPPVARYCQSAQFRFTPALLPDLLSKVGERNGKTMGTIVQAHCNCGYRSSLLPFGAGMLNFQTVCMVPAECARCRTVVDVDYLISDRRCPTCGVPVVCYVRLTSGADHWTDMSWRLPSGDTAVLPPSSNPCPACGKHSLTFAPRGNFD